LYDDGAMPRVAAIVMAAGKGTRMHSSIAKVLHPLCGRAMVAWSVAPALDVGAAPVAVVVGHQGEAVERACRDAWPHAPLRFARQEPQLGTGHAVQVALGALDDVPNDARVLILSGDVPLLGAATLRALLDAAGPAELAVVGMRPADPTGYGRLVRCAAGLARIVEHRDAGDAERAIAEVNAGIYLATCGLLREVLGTLSNANAQGEYYLPDVVPRAAGRGAVPVLLAGAEEVGGVNDRAQLAAAAATLRRRLNDALMKGGVSMEDPACTYVDASARVGRDVTIGAGAHLVGRTVVGDGAVVGAGSWVEDVVVDAGERVPPLARRTGG
jgi:bifunctional UDP-N-acetylglucosamine pyrophosphorylase/glucosamine-1-phosphate N-acetyltransferase